MAGAAPVRAAEPEPAAAAPARSAKPSADVQAATEATMLKARFVENSAFQGEFRANTKGDPPLELMPLMTAAEDVHERFQSSTTTILDGWKSEPDAKLLESGIAAFKEMVIHLNAAVDTGNAWAKDHAAPGK